MTADSPRTHADDAALTVIEAQETLAAAELAYETVGEDTRLEAAYACIAALERQLADAQARERAAVGYARSGWGFLRQMWEVEGSEEMHSLRREATEDIELALRVLGFDAYATAQQEDSRE